MPIEQNPFSGKASDYYNLELFDSQIKSILSSESLERIKIMFPMISTIEDYIEAKAFVTKAAKELNVEVPHRNYG